MQQIPAPIVRDIVLIGGGHSHAVLLRMCAMQSLPGVRVTVICTDTDTPYSGMLPGYVAGHYDYDAVHIDLRRLAEFAGARYFHDEVVGIDRGTRNVMCRQRPPVPYDALSINIGSTPQVGDVPGASEFSVPVKPIRRFNERWLALLARVRAQAGPITIAVVGAGAGGVEMTLAMQFRLCNELTAMGRHDALLHFHLFSADPTILPTHNTAVRAAFLRTLTERGVHLHLAAKVTHVRERELQVQSGEVIAADEILWVTQAGGPAWLRDTGLALDSAGFVKVRDTLQTETDPIIFAAGDCAAFTERPLEKAGVFAVRMGKPLFHNLRRLLTQQALLHFRPQQHWLALISTGDQHAIASRGALYARGDWVWRWKDWIDRRFMRTLSEFPETMPARGADVAPAIGLDANEKAQALSAIAMRCGGCGAKVGATVLSRALSKVHPLARDDVLIGLHEPDDAAVVKVPPGMAMVHTVDFFRTFIDDPYVFGRIAANHALGDISAMGGTAQSATAIVTVPPGLEAKVEDTVLQMMTGAVEVLNAAHCSLVGGHTGEGHELAMGFAVNGLIAETLLGALTKGGMRAGDVLILTKPIGTGTLFAANVRLKARGRWIDAALASMQISNAAAVPCLLAHGATACTDVTGFGLLGHLLEMTRLADVDAELDLNALPVLDGAVATSAAGLLSSLHPANACLRCALRNQETAFQHPNYPLIFDPQTAGGLLASVPAAQADAAVAALRGMGYPATACIGRVLARGDDLASIVLRT